MEADFSIPLSVWLTCVEEVVELIKGRFPNLPTQETIQFAHAIVHAIAKRVEQP